MDMQTWQHLLEIEQEFIRRGECFSRKMIGETMGCGVGMARLYEFAIKNKSTIRLEKEKKKSFDGLRVALICDIHIPFQDDVALNAVFSYLDSYDPNMIIIDGDMLDFYKLSRFIKHVGKKSVKRELEEGKKFLTDLRARYPRAEIIYKEGNHETHMERYILSNASEIADLVDDLIINRLNLTGLNIQYKKDFFCVGKLWVLHGHEKPQGSGQTEYVTNVVFKYTLDHTIFGHWHRTQDKVFKRIDGSTLWVGACGYLGGPMEYAPLNNWNQGFATINFGHNNVFRAHLHKIEGGVIY